MTTAEKAVQESIDKGDKPIVTKDEDGNEFHQRPFNIDDVPKPKPKRKARTVKVISIAGAKMFLSDNDFIMPHEEKSILESDYKIVKDRVRKIS